MTTSEFLQPHAPIAILVLDADVRNVDGLVVVRQLVRLSPGRDLERIAFGLALTVAAPAIARLQEALVLALQLEVENDPRRTAVACLEPLGGLDVGAIALGVVLELAGFAQAGIELLTRRSAGVSARPVGLEEVTPFVGQHGDGVAASVLANRAHEPGFAEVPQVPHSRVRRAARVVAQVAGRHDAKRAHRGQHPALGAADLVDTVAAGDALARVAARKLEALGEQVARVGGRPLATVRRATAAAADLRPLDVHRPGIVTPARVVAGEHRRSCGSAQGEWACGGLGPLEMGSVRRFMAPAEAQ